MKAVVAISLIVLVASAFAMSFRQPYGDDKANLQMIFAGFWENAGLADPVNLINCFDPPSANLTMITIGSVLSQLAANKIQQAIQTAENYGNQLPDAVKTCAQNDPETQQVGDAYKISNYTQQQLEAKFLAYATLHHSAFQSQINTMNTEFQQADYKDVGKNGGKLLQAIIGS